MKCMSFSCKALIWTQEKKTTANRRESALRAMRIGFAYPHFRNPASLSCSSLIGSVRANPVAAPAAPNRNSSLRLILRLREKNNSFICNDQWTSLSQEALRRRQDLPERSRKSNDLLSWGRRLRRQPAPDEGTSRRVDSGLDAESGLPQPSKSLICEGHDEREWGKANPILGASQRLASAPIQVRAESPKRRANLWFASAVGFLMCPHPPYSFPNWIHTNPA